MEEDIEGYPSWVTAQAASARLTERVIKETDMKGGHKVPPNDI